jgi:hypothetical protein
VQYGGKNIRNYIQYFLHLVLFSLCAFWELYLSCVYCHHLMCICCILCLFVVNICVFVVLLCVTVVYYVYLLYFLCVFVVPYVYLLYYVCIVVLTLDAGLLARSRYPEGPATGHLNTGFSWFPCVYKRMLSWFPSFQDATTCLSCSPPDLNFLVTFFFFPYLCICNIITATR